ncbi:MAG: hypothetical protein WDW38_006650 [Sanguina aurantia]
MHTEQRLHAALQSLVHRLDSLEAKVGAMRGDVDAVRLRQRSMTVRPSDESRPQHVGVPFPGLKYCGRCVELKVSFRFDCDGTPLGGAAADIMVLVGDLGRDTTSCVDGWGARDLPGLLAVGRLGVALSRQGIRPALAVMDRVALSRNRPLPSTVEMHLIPVNLQPLALAILKDDLQAKARLAREVPLQDLVDGFRDRGSFFTRARVLDY